MPAMSAVWKEQDIMETGICRMEFADSLKRSGPFPQYDIARMLNLLPGSRKDYGNLVRRGQVIAAAVTRGIKA